MALTDLLDDIDFDNIVDVDSLKSSLDELEDAALQLVSGSDTLADGAGTLADGVNSYTEGADTLNDAIQKYLGSNGELNGSVTEYVNGVNKVVKGVQDYTDGTNALFDVTWNSDELAKVDTKTAGRTFTVNGTVTVEGTAYDAVMNVEVLDASGLVQEVPEGSLGSVDFLSLIHI